MKLFDVNRGSRLRMVGLCLSAVLVVLISCQKEKPAAAPEAATKAVPAAPPAPPPPPPAPETSLGKLVRIDRSQKTAIEAMGLGGAHQSEIQAEKGKTFVVLQFEGKGRAHAGQLFGFVGMGEDRPMSKTDERSWLTDAQGKKYTPALLVVKKQGCQLSFEAPTGATGLVWHDGKTKSYQLEPQPIEVQEPAATAAAPGKPKP